MALSGQDFGHGIFCPHLSENSEMNNFKASRFAELSQRPLGFAISLLRRFAVTLDRFNLVFLHTFAVSVAPAKIVICLGLAEPLDRFTRIFLHAVARTVADAEITLGSGILLLSGCGNTADQTAKQGLYYGLWAGNVEVVPARPTEFPARFFEKAPATRRMPIDSQGRAVVMDPTKMKKPFWVFADQVSLQSVADKIHAAMTAGRPIVIVGADQSSIEEVFGQTLDSHLSSNVPLTRTAWSWLPWMTQRLTEGSLLSAWNPATAQGQALYYEFMVDSTLRLDSPRTPATE